jgi:hypothetical protein
LSFSTRSAFLGALRFARRGAGFSVIGEMLLLDGSIAALH